VPRHPGDKKSEGGDIVNVDVTVIKDGWHGDTSRMFYVGTPSIQASGCRITMRRCGAASRGRPGALGDIGAPIQRFAESHGFSVVREFCGHGIGAQFHEEPQVLHLRKAGHRLKLSRGMIFTIEPMINAGAAHSQPRRRLDDRHRRPLALGAVGAHGARARDGYEVLTVSPARRPACWHWAELVPPGALPPWNPPHRATRIDAQSTARNCRDALDAPRVAARLSCAPDTPSCCASRPGWWTACFAACGAISAARGWRSSRSADTVAAQLFPHSDVDVLILLPAAWMPRAPRSSSGCRLLWDIGWTRGHSVRTHRRMRDRDGGDITIARACSSIGSRRLARAPAFSPRIAADDRRARLSTSEDARAAAAHLDYHDTAYNSSRT
jgi:hypothetical protein